MNKTLKLKDFGQPNRVQECVKKIEANIGKKIQSAQDALQLPKERKPKELSTLFGKLIFHNLMQSCSENGYNVTL